MIRCFGVTLIWLLTFSSIASADDALSQADDRLIRDKIRVVAGQLSQPLSLGGATCAIKASGREEDDARFCDRSARSALVALVSVKDPVARDSCITKVTQACGAKAANAGIGEDGVDLEGMLPFAVVSRTVDSFRGKEGSALQGCFDENFAAAAVAEDANQCGQFYAAHLGYLPTRGLDARAALLAGGEKNALKDLSPEEIAGVRERSSKLKTEDVGRLKGLAEKCSKLASGAPKGADTQLVGGPTY